MAKTVSRKARNVGKAAETAAVEIRTPHENMKALRSSEGEEAKAGDPNPADRADAAGKSSDAGAGPSAPDARPAETAPAGTLSTDTPESESREGGAGNPAGSAPDILTSIEKQIAAGDLEGAEKRISEIENMRKALPFLSAAVDAWKAEGKDMEPTGIRIAAKRDGFRRAGMAHPKAPTDHPLTAFNRPEQMEALFAEPNLKVELI